MSQTSPNKITLFTIGFTQKPAEAFFTRLADAGVKRVVDVRLNNSSQLAAFAKQDDLRYFLKAIGRIEYLHCPDLAPTSDLLSAYKKKEIDWNTFEERFCELIEDRKAEETLSREMLDQACLLCSEALPDCCHRRLLAEYLSEKIPPIEICHL